MDLWDMDPGHPTSVPLVLCILLAQGQQNLALAQILVNSIYPYYSIFLESDAT